MLQKFYMKGRDIKKQNKNKNLNWFTEQKVRLQDVLVEFSVFS